MLKLNRSASWVIGQVIIRGKVVDKTTGLPIPGYTVRLLDCGVGPAVEITLAQYHLSLKQTSEGEFGFFGVPEAIPLTKTHQYQWRVDVGAPGYKTHEEPFPFGPLGTQPKEVEVIRPVPGDTRPIGGDTFSVRLFNADLPLDLGALKLDKIL